MTSDLNHVWTDTELLTLVQGYTEAQLRTNFASAAKHPGTDWHIRLLAEFRRRGLIPEGPSDVT